MLILPLKDLCIDIILKYHINYDILCFDLKDHITNKIKNPNYSVTSHCPDWIDKEFWDNELCISIIKSSDTLMMILHKSLNIYDKYSKLIDKLKCLSFILLIITLSIDYLKINCKDFLIICYNKILSFINEGYVATYYPNYLFSLNYFIFICEKHIK